MAGVVLAVAIVVGILFGYVAGIAVALIVPTILLLGLGMSRWGTLSGDDPVRRYWEQEGFGSDSTERRREQ